VITIEYDLGYLRRSIPELEAYLLSKAAQWPLGGHSIPLTVEGLLLSLQILHHVDLQPEERCEYQKLEQTYQETMKRWRHAWGVKATQGFQQRLRLWRTFVDELNHQPDEHAKRYVYEVRLRVMLALLQPCADQVNPEEFTFLAYLDQQLAPIFHPTSFIWPPELKPAFPTPTFWYLHGLPTTKRNP
jgi:hypothetical protein